MPQSTASPNRLLSLDQFRGYTVLAMLVVNFVGSFVFTKQYLPTLCHHNTYCSYADTIMPQFFFAVGFGFRYSFIRRLESTGFSSATLHAIKRNLTLLILAIFVYGIDVQYRSWEELSKVSFAEFILSAFQRRYFQTLTHIAIASLWILPVIGMGAVPRLAYAIATAILFTGLSHQWYFEWAMKVRVIDGGPLGFLGWSIPLVTGSLCCDLLSSKIRRKVSVCCLASVSLMAIGYLVASTPNLSSWISSPERVQPTTSDFWYVAAPPFVPPWDPVVSWTMNQRTASISYMLFSSGFSLFLFGLFVVACDRQGWQFELFRLFGQNALLAYLLHMVINESLSPLFPKDSPGWYVAIGLAISIAACVVALKSAERIGIRLRI